jgi:hypothetical protein
VSVEPAERQHRGRIVALGQQHLVTGGPPQPVRDQVQPVRGAVTQDDLVGPAADQARQQLPESLRPLLEGGVRDAEGCGFLGEGPLGRGDRDRRQRTLVRGVQPASAGDAGKEGRPHVPMIT